MFVKLIFVYFVLGSTLIANMAGGDDPLSWFIGPAKKKPDEQIFFGLSFTTDEQKTKCQMQEPNIMLCQFFGQDGHRGPVIGEMFFERQVLSSAISLPLVRLKRIGLWHQENKALNQYVEQKQASLLGSLVIQQALAYYLDNISFPVLLRAFDVVMPKYTIISVRVKCDFRYWPALEKEINSIVTSLKKVAKN